jgi:hypothetical protein
LPHADAPVDADIGEMPEFALKLLPFLLPRKARITVAGDLAEEFWEFATGKLGRPYA